MPRFTSSMGIWRSGVRSISSDKQLQRDLRVLKASYFLTDFLVNI